VLDSSADPTAAALHRLRGALLLYPVVEQPDGSDVVAEIRASDCILALVVVAPTTTGSPDRALVRFVVRDSSKADEPIVEL
jgi:hypothetical protein